MVVLCKSKIVMATRRNFIRQIFCASAMTSLFPDFMMGKVKKTPAQKKLKLKQNDCILFYGDSITDGNRNRENRAASKPDAMGGGYALSVSSYLACKYPNMGFNFFNRGINGNKTFQMIDRLQQDCIDLKPKPTVVSILTGINDYAKSYVAIGKGNTEKYEQDLRELITKIREALPGVRILMMEPYALPDLREKTDEFLPDFYSYQPIAAKVAVEMADVYVPLQKHFDEAFAKYGKQYFSTDGVHPWAGGIEMISRAWLDAVEVR